MSTVRTPYFLRNLPVPLVWNFPHKEKTLFLTFDDGPTPGITPVILSHLQKYGAKATFFCLGKNVVEYPDLYSLILQEGHSVGNHTHNHLNGWKTKNAIYLSDVEQAGQFVKSHLFRPPYGRIKASQMIALKKHFRIVMWEVLSKDYGVRVSPEKCLQNVLSKARDGSIIVFHDSVKAKEKMLFALPRVLEHFSNEGFCFEAIPAGIK
jgi:peptidoglycan-N-acetylglucosamine deacetylase